MSSSSDWLLLFIIIFKMEYDLDDFPTAELRLSINVLFKY